MKKFMAVFVMLITACFMTVACSCGKKDVDSISLTGGFPTGYTENEEVDYTKIKVTVKYSDGTTEVLTSDKLTIGRIDTSTVGDKTVTVEYGGETLRIPVVVSNDLDQVYTISGVDAPIWLTTSKTNFLDQSEKDYIVGDDNPFKFLLELSVLDNNRNEIPINKYKSVSEVYLFDEGTNNYEKINATNLEVYVTVDEENSTYDFTQTAVGKKFKLVIRPENLTEAQLEDPDMYQTFEFRVEDGWNVYSAKELSVFDNSEDNVDDWRAIKSTLANKGIYSIDDQNYQETLGIMIHGNIDITVDDIPASYIYNSTEATATELTDQNFRNTAVVGTLKDGTYIYERVLTGSQKFHFYGNFFTISVAGNEEKGIAPIPAASDLGEDSSNATLFNFSGKSKDLATSKNDYTMSYIDNNSKYYVENVNFVGNAKKQEDEPQIGLGGLIMMRTQYSEHHVTNCSSQAFFISVLADWGGEKFIGEKLKIADSYQNAVFVFGGIDFTLNNSVIKDSGGPAIISQHEDSDEGDSDATLLLRAPNVTLNQVDIDTPVAGAETWFKAYGLDTIVGDIKAFDDFFKPFGKSFLNSDKMTIVNVLMSGGMFGEDTTGQGKLTINNEVIANKYLSDNAFSNSINAFNALSQQIPALSEAPLFMGENGKSAFYMPVEGVGEYLIDPIEALTAIQTYASAGGDLTNQQNIVGLLIGASILDDNPINGLFAADNQYITLYYMGAAITLEYYNLAN